MQRSNVGRARTSLSPALTYTGTETRVLMVAVMGHHPGFSGDESFFKEDLTGKPESAAWVQACVYPLTNSASDLLMRRDRWF